MKRRLLAGLAAIALLTAGGLLTVLAVERGAGPASAGPAEPAAQGSRLEASPRPAEPAGPPPRGRETTWSQAPAPAGATPADAAPPPPPDMGARLQALAPLRDEVLAGLAALDGRLAACRLPVPELVLDLAALDRRVHVVDVRPVVREPGELPEGVPPPPEDPEAFACARRVLRDELLPAPSARAGRRWELRWAPGAAR